MRWWGLGKGYFRNALSLVLLGILAGMLVLLLLLQRTLRPLMIHPTRTEPLPPLRERVMVRSDQPPAAPLLGDWLLFVAISDSCIAHLEELRRHTPDPCNKLDRFYRAAQRALAAELNRYGWSVAHFEYYAHRAIALHRDSIPQRFRPLASCITWQRPQPVAVEEEDSVQLSLVRMLLRGRTWWIELGFAEDVPPAPVQRGTR